MIKMNYELKYVSNLDLVSCCKCTVNSLIRRMSSHLKMHECNPRIIELGNKIDVTCFKMVVETDFAKTYVFNLFVQHLEKVDLT